MNMHTEIITAKQAEEIGRRAADIATAEVSPDEAFPRQPLSLMAGGLLQTLRGAQRSRDGLIRAVKQHLASIRGRTGSEARYLAPDERGTQRAEDVRECRLWLRRLRRAMAQHPNAVRRGVEAWVDDYIDGQNLNPGTLQEMD